MTFHMYKTFVWHFMCPIQNIWKIGTFHISSIVSYHGIFRIVDFWSGALYNGGKVTVLEAVSQFFEWFTDHPKTSKGALLNMLHM